MVKSMCVSRNYINDCVIGRPRHKASGKRQGKARQKTVTTSEKRKREKKLHKEYIFGMHFISSSGVIV